MLREIQDVDEVIPARVQKQGVLVGSKLLGVDAEELIDGPDFDVTIPRSRHADLHTDLSVIRREGLLTQHDIDIKRTDGIFQDRFLGRTRRDSEERHPAGHEQARPKDAPLPFHDASRLHDEIARTRLSLSESLDGRKCLSGSRWGSARGDTGSHDFDPTTRVRDQAFGHNGSKLFRRHLPWFHINECVVGYAFQIDSYHAGHACQSLADRRALRNTVLSGQGQCRALVPWFGSGRNHEASGQQKEEAPYRPKIPHRHLPETMNVARGCGSQ
ncbi:MAG: hypothetical protein DCC63_06725 [Nitrospira sp.]|nr:MAG: hypothetical protein DCC63_06725 [Nitrospira sp.]